jgi:hypothetical protein
MDKQQFLILGKSARGRALAELINRATAEPGIFTFGELLNLPNVQEVCSLNPQAQLLSCSGLLPPRCSGVAVLQQITGLVTSKVPLHAHVWLPEPAELYCRTRISGCVG